MTNIEELEKLIKDDALVEVEENIKELEELKKKKKKVDEELEYMYGVKKYFCDLLALIEVNEVSEEQALEILMDLNNMRVNEDGIF